MRVFKSAVATITRMRQITSVCQHDAQHLTDTKVRRN